MEEAKKRVYGRREVRMFLAYDGKLSKGQCLSVHHQHGNRNFLLRQV